SAESGLNISQFKLAECYRYGFGIPIDLDLALKWYQKAHENGHDRAGEL
ncbi:8987_t:CDS:1, partial [Ambispora gerdemannii]